MWPFRDPKNVIPTFTVDNTIAGGTRVRGDLSGPAGFRIDGAIEGTVEAHGPVVVGEAGSVEGSVCGSDVVVLGRVRGDVRASGHLEIGPKGKVLGNITVQSFRMHAGGVFRGTSTMPGGEEATPALGQGIRIALSSESATRTRTLPPPNGAVPPPPTLADLASIVPALPSIDESASQERLIPAKDAKEARRATGT